MASDNLIQTLNLTPDERLNPPKMIGRLKSMQEWASAAIDGVKDNKDFLSSLAEISPWAEAVFSAAKDTIGPVKFLVKVFDEMTKVQEPEPLARILCTVAYQTVALRALKEVGTPSGAATWHANFDATVDELDFSDFTLRSPLAHPFVAHADRILIRLLRAAGYQQVEADRVINLVHDALPSELKNIVSGKSAAKFDPLFRWLQLPQEQRLSRAAIRRHGEYISWLFRKAAVLNTEPYALSDVWMESECGKLTFGELTEKSDQRKPLSPFDESDAAGGRHKLLDVVMGYIANPKFRDALVIQGVAGSGKSSFTLRLADHLREQGFSPIRVRLRDMVMGQEFFTQIGDAIRYQDEEYLSAADSYLPPVDVLQSGVLFGDTFQYRGHSLCKYVLILDGWDEISVAVSEGLRQRVRDLLMTLRGRLLVSDGRPTVGLILTGRPSDAVHECTEFFRKETPILTIRQLGPKQLPEYASKVKDALDRRPLATNIAGWAFPEHKVLAPIFERYELELKGTKEATPLEASTAGVSAVLGFPLLLHVTFRLLAEGGTDAKQLIESPTTLLRKLTDYAVSVADQPSDRQTSAKFAHRITGDALRRLLQQTAAIMTILGREGVSKAELERRLKIQDLGVHLKGLGAAGVISSLLISFYFKGGNAALGCEFTHKAFREYLFAEHIVQLLKQNVVAIAKDRPAERRPDEYWKEFEDENRRKSAKELLTWLGPQWLSPEVAGHLEGILNWEVKRSHSANRLTARPGEIDPLNPDTWQWMLTFLADMWEWWLEGVHLRPQPQEIEETSQKEWRRCLADQLVPHSKPFAAEPGFESIPVRTTTLDSHLGDALFRLCAWVHALMWDSPGRATGRVRRVQSTDDGKLRFRPGAGVSGYFQTVCARINAGGWRPRGRFPSSIHADCLDLRQSDLSLSCLRVLTSGTLFSAEICLMSRSAGRICHMLSFHLGKSWKLVFASLY